MKKNLLFFVFISIFQNISAQEFSRKDSLQGGFSFERTCFDIQLYVLDIKVNPDEKYISGVNYITFKIIENTHKIQLDLFENMKVDSLFLWNSSGTHLELDYEREFDAVFVEFEEELQRGEEQTILFYYSGKPKEAKNAPWDGGFVWKKDSNGNPFVGVAVQGTGASLWYPCKDSQSDEPDRGVLIDIKVPNGLIAVSNGKFVGQTPQDDGYSKWQWIVKNPINNYNITLNIGDYVTIFDNLNDLDLEYYVLRENKEKAKKHFEEDVKPMLECFQEKFGEYPFKEDGYKLVETPYLGMEHQSAIAYGNHYKKGYLGFDPSRTGVGMLFDYIIIHETGHEWFGNSITSKDIADMWIHEGFTTYSETVFVECLYGYEKAMQYINGQKNLVENKKRIIGAYGVNKKGSIDMYYKGSLLLNTLRHIINDDAKWWEMLLKYSETYRHTIIDTETVIAFFNAESKMSLTPVFDQYLKYKNIPVLEFQQKGKNIEYRWKTDVPDFEMPVDIHHNEKKIRLYPTNSWKKFDLKIKNLSEIEVLTDYFYINVSEKSVN